VEKFVVEHHTLSNLVAVNFTAAAWVAADLAAVVRADRAGKL